MAKPLKPIVQRPRADRDIDEIVEWLLRQAGAELASRFLDAIEAAYDLLSRNPGIGSRRHAKHFPDLPQALRFHPLKTFPRILVYYVDGADAVEVIRIWDAARGLEALVDGPDEK